MVICIYSLEKCLFISFAQFLISFLLLLLLNCMNSVYILDTNSLSCR